jgi:hypothetical protein
MSVQEVNKVNLGGDNADAPRTSVLKTTASYIITTEFCERLAYYGFAGSLVLFFQTKLNMSNEEAVNQFYAWYVCMYVCTYVCYALYDCMMAYFYICMHDMQR